MSFGEACPMHGLWGGTMDPWRRPDHFTSAVTFCDGRMPPDAFVG
jgi:hypothetical protein